MVLKSAESYAHAMILALLPYLQCKISKEKVDHVAPLIAKWLKLAAWAQAVNAYWICRMSECIKNTSNKMLELATNNMDDLYWALEVVVQSPKRKQTQVDEESLDNLVSMVKTTVSQKKNTEIYLENLPIDYCYLSG